MSYFWIRWLPRFLRHRVEQRPGLQRYVDNTGWLIIDQVVRLGVAFIVTAWIARYLGPDDFGVFNYVLGLIAIFGALSALGIDGIVVRELVRFPGQDHRILGSSLGIKLVGGAIAYTAVIGTVFLIRPNDSLTQLLTIVLGAVLLFRSCDVFEAWFQAKVSVRYSVVARSIVLGIMAIVKAGLIIGGATLVAFIGVTLLEGVFMYGAVALLYFYRRKPHGVLRPDRVWVRRLMAASWPLFLSTVVYMLYVRIDQIMVREMLGDHAAGLYSAVILISEVWIFIPAAIATSVFPAIVSYRERNDALYHPRLQAYFQLAVYIAVPIAIVVSLTAGYLVQWIFGPEYREASDVLVIHVWHNVFAFLLVASAQYLIAEGMTLFAFFRNFFGAFVKISLNLLLIPRYGLIGAAYATIAAYFCSGYLANIFYPKAHALLAMKTRALLFSDLWEKHDRST